MISLTHAHIHVLITERVATDMFTVCIRLQKVGMNQDESREWPRGVRGGGSGGGGREVGLGLRVGVGLGVGSGSGEGGSPGLVPRRMPLGGPCCEAGSTTHRRPLCTQQKQ